jgi:hypothetical protein
MKVAIITDTVIIHGLAEGFHSTCPASSSCKALTVVLIQRSLDFVWSE